MLKEIISVIICINVASADFRGSIVYNNYEYAYYDGGTDTTNWVAAYWTCPSNAEGSGGMLAMLKTREIDYNVGTLMDEIGADQAWIGGSDEYLEGSWNWADGTLLEYGYINWTPGQPDNGAGTLASPQNCMRAFRPPSILWDDKICISFEYMGHVCQFPLSGQVKSDYSQVSIHKPDETSGTFLGAKETCMSAGARLLQITDENKKAILNQLGSGDYAKYWVDMENGGSKCSVLSQDGSEEHDCNEKGLGFICETARPNLIKISEQSPVIAQSSDLKIECTVFGFPVPDAAWYKDKKLVPNQTIGAGSATLVITNASEADEGKYVCIATNVIDGKANKIMGLSTVSVTTDGN